MSGETKYWFRAKRYGWGWGLPLAWQGWAVYFLYFALVLYSASALRLHRSGYEAAQFLLVMMALTIALILVCLWKGEPAKWRWGE